MLASQAMLRRRRSVAVSLVPVKSPAASRKKLNRRPLCKLKMSPYPEVEGRSLHTPCPLKEIENHPEYLKINTSLSFTDTEEASSALSSPAMPTTQVDAPVPQSSPDVQVDAPVPQSSPDVPTSNSPLTTQPRSIVNSQGGNLRPTHMLALDRKKRSQKHELEVSEARGGNRERMILKGSRSSKPSLTKGETSFNGEKERKEEPSAHVRGLWDSVVSWMKMAVDFVAQDSTAEAEPSSSSTTSQGKKRPLGSNQSSPLPPLKQPRSLGTFVKKDLTSSRQRKSCDKGRGSSGKKRMAFGGFAAPAGPSVNDGLGQLLMLEPSKENSNSGSDITMRSVPPDPVPMKCPFSPLANSFSASLSIETPDKKPNRIISNRLNFSAHNNLQSSHFGLNSILDGSPDKTTTRTKRIRRQSLRSFYGRSVHSPNLTEVQNNAITVRRSPRLQAAAERNPLIPLPPPPPPLPPSIIPLATSIPPPPPPALPLLSKVLGDTGGNHPRDVLNQMQSRLRSRIKRKGAGGSRNGDMKGGVSANEDPKQLDIKVKQWAEIQAYSRKLSCTDFLSLAEKKRAELEVCLRGLEEGTPPTVEGISQVVELLQEGSLWYPGGSKEMRESLPLYKKLERKIETMNEYVQVCEEMRKAVSAANLSNGHDLHYVELYNTLLHIREDFSAKHRHWGPILTTNADSWAQYGLPICHTLLVKSCAHLCVLVDRYMSLCLQEASRLTGILISMKCMRTTQLKEKLKDCLNLLFESHPYFTLKVSNSICRCEQCTSGCGPSSSSSESDMSLSVCNGDRVGNCDKSSEEGASRGHNESDEEGAGHDKSVVLLSLSVQVVLAYIHITLQQFDGYVCQSHRQSVCEHFEGVLKMVSLIKSLVSAVLDVEMSGDEIKMKGFTTLLPNGGELSGLLYASCVKLIQHIVGCAQSYMTAGSSPARKEKQSNDMVLWMMFGCKYIHQVLEFLGLEQADQRGLVNLLAKLQEMENCLPDYN